VNKLLFPSSSEITIGLGAVNHVTEMEVEPDVDNVRRLGIEILDMALSDVVAVY
jgi:hypothetical protein